MSAVQVGDVLQSAAGTQRVVRKVSMQDDGRLRSVTFSILHCSWTHRPYTVMTASDLRIYGYAPVGHRVRLRTKLDRALNRAINDHTCRELSCCAVKGIA
jgi:hypothetical protein